MANFEMKCPHCQTALLMQNEWIGMEAECPSCKKTFTIRKSQLVQSESLHLRQPHVPRQNNPQGKTPHIQTQYEQQAYAPQGQTLYDQGQFGQQPEPGQYGPEGQAPYGQAPYGAQGQTPYGQPQYGPEGQAPYGQAPYGAQGQAPYGQPSQTPYGQSQYYGPPQSRTTFILLGIFLGSLGVHNFYAGYTNKGIIQLVISILTLPVFGCFFVWIWAVIEVCTVTVDAHGQPMKS